MNSVVTAYPDALPEATSTSLTLPETLTFEQWEQIGAELANRARKLNWWIGDWWAAGHHRYGERARLAAKGLFGKEFKTLANIASVCRAFDPSRRREDLSWSHHAEAAALSPNAADMLLDLAERDRMSKAQVRAAVTTIRGGPASRTAPDEAAVAGLFRSYNRLPAEVRMLVAQAFAAANGAEIDPATGEPKADSPPADTAPAMATEAAIQSGAAPAPEPEIETAFLSETENAEADVEARTETETETAPNAEKEPEPGTWPAEVEFDTFDLGPDLETVLGEVEPEVTLNLAAEMEALPVEAEAGETFDLASDMEEPEPEPEPELVLEPDTSFDLTLDMAALQGEEAEATAPFDLAAAMEAPQAEDKTELDTALDLDFDMAMTPGEAIPSSAFDLEAAMELAQGGDDPLDLEPQMEKKEGEEDEEAPAVRPEPWLLP